MDFIKALIELSNAMAPYILFGLLIAGILHEIVPQDFIKKHLGKSSISSVIKSTLFGIPIPVCSCGVIPLATSLQKSGASKGSVLSFLISTPITGIDSILATYGIFGFAFTIYRIISSMILAITAGILVNIFEKDDTKTTSKFSQGKILLKTPTNQNIFLKNKKGVNFSNNTPAQQSKKRFSIINALKYGFITLLKDIAKPLFWGLAIGAAITVATPKDLSIFLNEYPALSYLITVAIAVPMYVCATASLPIAAALVLNGVSLGAAFVFLSAGPATNTVTIGVVKKMVGKKATIIYLLTIALGSILFGVLIDLLLGSIDVKNIVHIDHNAGIVSQISSIILWSFVLYFMFKERFSKRSCCSTY